MNLLKLPVFQKGLKRIRRRTPEQIKDAAYQAWLRTLPCAHCHHPAPSDPAHVRLGGRSGMGMKPLFSALPLCRRCHTLQHNLGHTGLWETDDWLELADNYLKKWRGLK